MPEIAPQPVPVNQHPIMTDPFFNPEVAKTWPPPDAQQGYELPAPQEVIKEHSYWQELHDRRFDSSVERAADFTNKLLERATPDGTRLYMIPDFLQERFINFPYDSGLSLSALVELRSFGILDAVTNLKVREQDNLITRTGIKLWMENLGNGHISTMINQEEDMRPLIDQLREGYADIPLAITANSLYERFSSSANGDISDSGVRFSDDLLGNMAVLNNLGFPGLGFLRSKNLAFKEGEANEQLSEMLNVALRNPYGRVLHEKGNTPGEDTVTAIIWRPDAAKPLTMHLIADTPVLAEADFANVAWRLGWSIDKSSAAVEHANLAPDATTEPFIDRPTGRALLASLESVGLRLSDKLEMFLQTEDAPGFDDRYGGAYTQISYELAKIVNDRRLDRFSSLFVASEATDNGSLVDRLYEFSAQPSDDQPLAFIKDLTRQLIERDKKGEPQPTDLPATKEFIHITDGACFDVAGYFAGAAVHSTGALINKKEGAIRFLYKTLGAKTMLNMDPVVFNGIRIPPGSLFSKAKDGGYVFHRLTPFNFSTEADMLSAFGTEIVKAEINEQVTMIEVLDQLREKAKQ